MAPVVQVTVVALTAITLVAAAPPISTVGCVAPDPSKPLPVMVTAVPPATGPVLTLMPVTVGVGVP